MPRKGYKQTIGHRLALSNVRRGVPKSIEHRLNISNALKKGSFVVCDICGESFYAPPSEVARIGSKYCSRQCGSVGISRKLSGRSVTFTREHCLNIGLARKGKKYPKLSEVKKQQYAEGKLIPWNKNYGDYMQGRKNPMYGHTRKAGIMCWCGKIHVKTKPHFSDRSGLNNSNWRNGVSFLPYPRQFNTALKELIKKRDGYKCVICGVVNRLGPHHIDYDKSNCQPENLVTLCSRCNSRVNSKRYIWPNYFFRYFYAPETLPNRLI